MGLRLAMVNIVGVVAVSQAPCKALSFIKCISSLVVVVHPWDSNTQGVQAGGPGVRDHSQLDETPSQKQWAERCVCGQRTFCQL